MIDPTKLKKGEIVEFAGGWQAQMSEQVRKDVVFVETIGPLFYKHHAFGTDHPIWQTAKICCWFVRLRAGID
jgi:hypothetical protein